MTTELVVLVHGIPAPQGSKTRLAHGGLVESSAKVAPWRALVTAAAVDAAQVATWVVEPGAPMALVATFTMGRPRSHYRTGKNAHLLSGSAPSTPATRPDLDKLIRSTLDALTDAGVLADDSRVVHLELDKVYPGGHLDALDSPGAVLTLSPWWC